MILFKVTLSLLSSLKQPLWKYSSFFFADRYFEKMAYTKNNETFSPPKYFQ